MPLLAGMPTPLRQALDAALLRADAPGGSVDPRAVSLAAAHALRALADRGAPDRRDRRSPMDRRALDPGAVVRPAARRRRADRRARVGQARIRLRGRSRGSRSGHDPDDPSRASARCRSSRSGGSFASERASDSPTPTWPGSTASPAATRCSQSRWPGQLPAMASGWTPTASGRCRRTSSNSSRRGLPRCRPPHTSRCSPSPRRPSRPGSWCSRSPDRASGRSNPWPGPRAPASSSGRVAGCRFSHPLLASTVYVNAPASERRALHVRLATHDERPGGARQAPGPRRRRARLRRSPRPSTRRPGAPACEEPPTPRPTSPISPAS